MKKNLFIYAFLAALVAGFIWAGNAAAQTPQPTSNPPKSTVSDDQVNAVAKQLYCPVCENIPLDVCQTQACIQWRDLIRQLLGQGKSPDYIKQYFVANYGDRVLGVPPLNPLIIAAYALLVLAFLGGVFLVVRALRSMGARPKAPAGPVTPPPADDPYMRRLEEELRKRE